MFLDQGLVNPRHHLLIAAVIQGDQFDLALGSADIDAAAPVDVIDPDLQSPLTGLSGQGKSAGRGDSHADPDRIVRRQGDLTLWCKRQDRRRHDQGDRQSSLEHGFLPQKL